jgi:hypothetical protein
MLVGETLKERKEEGKAMEGNHVQRRVRIGGHVSTASLPFALSLALFIISLLANFTNKRSLHYHRIL